MSTSVTLPALGESVTEGTVSRWLKQVGDTVEADEPLLEVSTDKVDTEIPSPAAGVSAGDQGAGGRDRRGRRRAGGDRRGERGHGGESRRRLRTRRDRGERTGAAEPAAAEPRARPQLGSRRREDGEASRSRHRRPAASGQPSGSGADGGAASGTEVTLPALGESVTEGTVSRWLKQVGDSGRGGRAIAGGLHRQGRHRDPLPHLRYGAGDPCPGGRDRRGRRGAGRGR